MAKNTTKPKTYTRFSQPPKATPTKAEVPVTPVTPRTPVVASPPPQEAKPMVNSKPAPPPRAKPMTIVDHLRKADELLAPIMELHAGNRSLDHGYMMFHKNVIALIDQGLRQLKLDD